LENDSQHHSQAKSFGSFNEIAITAFPMKHG